jgi:uncharacterized membrane protein YphA (DoxX/SURF4 family)
MSSLLDALHQPHVQLFLRLVLGGLLLLAGATKLAGRASFREAVTEYQVLPRFLEAPFAVLLPLVEVTLGGLLLIGLGTAVVAAIATPVFLSFTLAIGINLARGRSFDCHCFGSVSRDTIGAPAFLRSLALAIAALVVAVGASRFGALDYTLFSSSDRLPATAEIVPIVFLAFVVFDVLILLPEALATQAAFIRAHGHRMHGRQSRSAA